MMNGNPQQPIPRYHSFPSSSSINQHHQDPPPPPSASYPLIYSQETKSYAAAPTEKWGTDHNIMGTPNNYQQKPNQYLSGGGAIEINTNIPPISLLKSPSIIPSNLFSSTSSTPLVKRLTQMPTKSGTTTGSSIPGAALGKVSLTAKAIAGGGFEYLYKQTFTTFPNENLKKKFACYLSTSIGPVSGTLYLSNLHVAFCSDIPLSLTPPPSPQEAFSYYKVMIPLSKISSINPVVMSDASKNYIQIVTIDGHDFWFMGFVCFEKASRHLTESISNFSVAR